MTDQEQQDLSRQIAEALDTAGLGAYAWRYTHGRRCPRCDVWWGPEENPVDEPYTGKPCLHCGTALSNNPKDFTDATTLITAVEAWRKQCEGDRYWHLDIGELSLYQSSARVWESNSLGAPRFFQSNNPIEALALAFLAALPASIVREAQ